MVFTGQEGTAPQPHLAALILNPSLRWVSPEPDSTNQGDSSHTTNASGAGSARQREQERRGKKKKKKEYSRDKITRQDRRLGAAGAGSPAQESALATPVSTRARPADAPSLRWEPGEKGHPVPYSGTKVRVSETDFPNAEEESGVNGHGKRKRPLAALGH